MKKNRIVFGLTAMLVLIALILAGCSQSTPSPDRSQSTHLSPPQPARTTPFSSPPASSAALTPTAATPTPKIPSPSTAEQAPTPSPVSTPSPAPSLSTGALAITTTSLPDGTVGEFYAQTLETSGTNDVDTYTWSITNGSLPDGLTLDTHTGFIDGTPTTVATSNYTIQITDITGAVASQSLSITVDAAPSTPVSTQTPIALPSL